MSRGANTVTVKTNLQEFNKLLDKFGENMSGYARPVAQAGAQVLYDRVRANVKDFVKPHWFYGENDVYGVGPNGEVAKRGPGVQKINPGNLRKAIYQSFSEDNSGKGYASYHVSYNYKKAPYAHMVEFGTSHSAPAHFVTNAINAQEQAVEAMKDKLLSQFQKAFVA